MAEQPAFNWRDYLHVDDNFPRGMRAEIERALDDIERFKDGEGQELIRRAYEVRGQRVRIGYTHVESRFLEQARPVVQLDVTAIGLIQWRPGDASMPGLVPMLTHELYHAGDSLRDVNEQAVQTLFNLLGIHDGEAQAVQLRTMIASNRPNRYFENDAWQVLRWLYAPGLLEVDLRNANMSALANRVENFAPRQGIQALIEAGVACEGTMNGRPVYYLRIEQDATRYTDALLARNYGPAYHLRGDYINRPFTASTTPALGSLSAEQRAQLARYMPLTGEDFATPGFAATPYAVGNLGDLPPPTVRQHTAISSANVAARHQ